MLFIDLVNACTMFDVSVGDGAMIASGSESKMSSQIVCRCGTRLYREE